MGTYNVARLAAATMSTNEPDAQGQRGAMVLETLRNDYLNAAIIRLDAGVQLGPK
jgi:hypothetical protein